MTLTIILLLLSSPLLAQLRNCTLQFEADSILVQNGAPANSTESLLCGIHVGTMEYEDRKYDNYVQENITWTEAKCLNENTIIFNSHGYQGFITDFNEREIGRFLTFECISSGPIKIVYSRHLRTRRNIHSGYYLAKTKQHVTILRVKFKSSKSGNYTFELNTANAKLTKWYYVYFNTTRVKFTHTDVDEFAETFDNPDDPLSIVVPCLANGPEQRPVVLVDATKESCGGHATLLAFHFNNITYKYVPGIGIVTEKANFVKKFQLISSRSFKDQFFVHCRLTSHQTATVLVNLGNKSSDDSLGGSNQILLRINSEFKPECYFQNQTLIHAPSKDGSLQIVNLDLITSSEWRFFAIGHKDPIFVLQSYVDEEMLPNQTLRVLDNHETCSGSTCVLNQPYKSGALRCSSIRYQLGYFIGLFFTGLDNRLYLLVDVDKLEPNVLIKMSVIQSDGISSQSKVYASETILLECTFVYYVLLPGISWILTFQNGTESLWNSPRPSSKDIFKKSRIFKERLTLTVPQDARTIQCAALLRDTSETFIKASHKLHLKVPPTVVETPKSPYTIRRNESKTVLNCVMKGDPQPTLYWTTNAGKNLSDVVVQQKSDGSINSELTILNFWRPVQKQTFTCVGVSSLGVARAEFLVEMEELKEEPWGIGVIAGVVAGFVGLIAAFIVVIVLVTRKYKAVISSKDISWFLNGNQTPQSPEDEINYSSQPYRTQKEVLQGDFSIDKTSILGSGSYGVVMTGHAHGQEVAVKTVKPKPSREVVMALLAEIKIMSSLEDHPNVVSYIGAHTSNISKGEVYLFVELCSLGTVEKFLKNKNASRCESITPPNEEHDSHLLKRLVNWSLQIVRGMKYLSECRVIHGDLAVRNLLLKDMDTVKITDFGLARQLQNYTIYKKTQQQPLPWRHMSPESLSVMEFSTKSDVWAFGVTMWEMFSLGAIPYTGLQWTIEFTSLLESGLRLDQRKFCPAPIYALMQKCWDWIPNARPGFAQLLAELEQMYISDYDNDYLDVGENNID